MEYKLYYIDKPEEKLEKDTSDAKATDELHKELDPSKMEEYRYRNWSFWKKISMILCPYSWHVNNIIIVDIYFFSARLKAAILLASISVAYATY